MEHDEFVKGIQTLRELADVIAAVGGCVISATINCKHIVPEDGRAINILLGGDDAAVMYTLAKALGVPIVEDGGSGVVEGDSSSEEYHSLIACTESTEFCMLVRRGAPNDISL